VKKVIIGLFVVMVTSVFINEKNDILIPDNAIRFQVIANSDEVEDQKLKLEIKNNIENKLYKLLENTKTIEEARVIINDNLNMIDNTLKSYNMSYDISFGNNYFPEKEYKGIKYPKGNYESLVITLGKGNGQNWWCVLFPPLCLLDENKNIDKYEYEFYATKLINKFTKN